MESIKIAQKQYGHYTVCYVLYHIINQIIINKLKI